MDIFFAISFIIINGFAAAFVYAWTVVMRVHIAGSVELNDYP